MIGKELLAILNTMTPRELEKKVQTYSYHGGYQEYLEVETDEDAIMIKADV
jgi:hypothetical protein